MAEDESKKSSGEKPPFFEWIMAAIGLILVGGSIGFTLYRALTEKSIPPRLSVSVNSITAVGETGGYLVTFRLENEGEITAADVIVEGEIKDAGKSLETGSVTFDYSPPHSERRGGLFFTKNPQQYNLEIRAKGYNEP